MANTAKTSDTTPADEVTLGLGHIWAQTKSLIARAAFRGSSRRTGHTEGQANTLEVLYATLCFRTMLTTKVLEEQSNDNHRRIGGLK